MSEKSADRLDEVRSRLPFPASESKVRFSESELAEIAGAFGKRLKEAFDFESNASIARRLEVPDMTVKNYVDGTRLPTGEMLLWISRKSGRSIDWLLTGRNSQAIEIEELFSETEIERIRKVRGTRSFAETVRLLTIALLDAKDSIDG